MSNLRMAVRGQRPSDDGFASRMAALYAAMFAFSGIQMPFLPVWLEAKALDASEIGLVLAVGMLARPMIVPVAMRIVDQRGWMRGALAVACWAACASFVAVALSDGFAAILVTFAISALPQSMVLPLAEAYALRGLAARERAYGPVRLWGSVTLRRAGNLGFGRRAWGDRAERKRACALGDRQAGSGGAGRRRCARRLPLAVAVPRLHRRDRGGEPGPGEPCRAVRLRQPAMGGQGPGRRGDRRIVGDWRAGRDRIIRRVRPAQ